MFIKVCAILLTILLVIFNVESRTTAIKEVSQDNDDNRNQSITADYAALRNDVQWFLQRLEILASSAEGMLPAEPTDDEDTRTFTETTRMHLLRGLKYLFAGLKEISISFQQNFETDHVRQLQQLKSTSEYLHDIIKILRVWFAQLRAAMAQILRIYNKYLPELLLGKCLGGYLVQTYPERQVYEYPFLLFGDIFEIFGGKAQTATAGVDEIEALDLLEDELNMTQNEIPHNEQDSDAKVRQPLNISSALALTDELSPIEEVEHSSWQQCLQLYTADSIARSLKMFFY